MAKADRDDALNTLASRLYATMLDDIVVDVALQSHQEVARTRRKCDICHTLCGQVHTPALSSLSLAGLPVASQQSTLPGSSPRPGTPPRDAGTPAPTGTPTPTPNGSVGKDGTVFLDCVGCGRATASNRYASHLSTCIGIGTGTRRAAARNATSKSRLGSDAGRSASPYPASENGNGSDHNSAPPLPQPGPKKKGRPPKNKPKASVSATNNATAVVNDDGEAITNRKRPGSPLSSPTKNSKKQKLSATPLARGGSNTPLGPPGTKSQSKIPSRLRESSIVSFLEPDATGVSPGSRSSSPGTAATPTSSVLGSGKLNGASGSGLTEEKRVPPRAPSPPRPPPPITRRPETDYLVDVEGDETGSSTDTDTD